MRYLLAIACLSVLSGLHAKGETDARWQSIVEQVRAIDSVHGRFAQERYSALRKRPLFSEGSVRFERGRNLILKYDPPASATLTFSPDGMTLFDRKGIQRIPTGVEMTQATGQAIWYLLDFDLNRARDIFEVSTKVTDTSWKLRAVPRENSGIDRLRAIELSGTKDRFNELVVVTGIQQRLEIRFSYPEENARDSQDE